MAKNTSNGNIIKKHTKEKNFTVIDNNIFMNTDLSLKGKGLITLLLSLPDGWQFSEGGLTKLSKDGRDGLRSGLVELETHGYLRREQTRTDGRFGDIVYHIYEIPTSDKPLLEKPTTVKPISEKPHNKELKNKVLINKELNNKELKNNKCLVSSKEFDKFWELYPRKVKRKNSKEIYLKKITIEDHQKIMSHVMILKHNGEWKDKKYIPHPTTYLNNERWNDGFEEDDSVPDKLKAL